mmetsp:Transcript_6683/g.17208  ORF Transcript_6683/g.17208 Transcript_6683/m.17208 type:complete len:225 (-) Transcript_6683:198-872(-)
MVVATRPVQCRNTIVIRPLASDINISAVGQQHRQDINATVVRSRVHGVPPFGICHIQPTERVVCQQLADVDVIEPHRFKQRCGTLWPIGYTIDQSIAVRSRGIRLYQALHAAHVACSTRFQQRCFAAVVEVRRARTSSRRDGSGGQRPQHCVQSVVGTRLGSGMHRGKASVVNTEEREPLLLGGRQEQGHCRGARGRFSGQVKRGSSTAVESLEQLALGYVCDL